MTSTGDRQAFWVVAALLALGIELVAVTSGGDGTWDMRNYHLYNPFALFHKPFGTDIAPAHMQTFFSPTLDLFYYGLATSISSVPVLNAFLAIPQALASVAGLALGWRLVRPRGAVEIVTLTLMTGLAVTGAAALPTIATSMSETLPAALVIAAWLVLIRPELDEVPSFRRLGAAGVLVGAACGLKLTLSFATIAMLGVLVLLPRRRWSDVVARPFVFGCGVFAGTIALTGYWWAAEWARFGNPLFPALNNLFRSPMAVRESFVDPTFLPHSLAEAVSAPWSWALSLSRATGESRLRDPRFALAIVAAVVALGSVLRPRRRPPWPYLLVPAWFVASFILWRLEFSIYRYLTVLEFAIGAVLAVATFPIARHFGRPVLLLAGSGLAVVAVSIVTVFPYVNRSPTADPAFTVDIGPVPPGAMVLLLDNEPMAYLAAFTDPRTRFIGTNDFFMSLDGSNPMQAWVAAAIEGHDGPIYGLDSPEDPNQLERARSTLAHYGFGRGACRPVVSNVSPEQIRLCRLERKSSD